MKPLRIYLSEELDRKFRKASMEEYGYSRGSLSRAAEEAVRSWIRTREGNASTSAPDEPVKCLRGLLANVKKKSVALQHESARIRARKTRGA